MPAMSFISAFLRWRARFQRSSGNESSTRAAWLMRGFVLLLAACHLPQAALAFIPPSQSVPVSAAVRRQLEHAACRSSFSVGASAMETWRWSSDGPPDSLRARVSCQPDSDFKGCRPVTTWTVSAAADSGSAMPRIGNSWCRLRWEPSWWCRMACILNGLWMSSDGWRARSFSRFTPSGVSR